MRLSPEAEAKAIGEQIKLALFYDTSPGADIDPCGFVNAVIAKRASAFAIFSRIPVTVRSSLALG
jgi:hypothetical protein